jgi:hypothetical protein
MKPNEDQLKILEEQRRQLQAVLRLPEGRMLIRRLLFAAGVWSSAYSPDPYNMAFLNGRRSVGVELLNEIVAIDPKVVRFFVEPETSGTCDDEPEW